MKQIYLKCFSVVFSRMWIAAAVAAGLLTATSIAFAAVEYTGSAGGKGGTEYMLDCGTYFHGTLVGIKGRAGSWVDSVQGVCVQINYDGTWNGSTWVTGIAGGSGGTSYNLTCAPNYVVAAIKGRAGSYIDQLGIYCQTLAPGGTLSGSGYFLSSTAGGTGGSTFGPLSCPSSKPARLIKGAASTWVDSIRLGCETADTLRINSLQLPIPVLRVGQTTGAYAKVYMSHESNKDITVSLTSSNNSVATLPGTISVIKKYIIVDAGITSLTPGCTKITASYKGSSDSENLLVHSAPSPYLSLETPDLELLSTYKNITVNIPSPAPAGGTTIQLTNLDPTVVTVPASVVIPQGAVSLGFQVTRGSNQLLTCARIKATGNGGEVTHAIRLYGSAMK